MSTSRFYGYKHWTLEEVPRCFNVGKGTKGRSDSRLKRNHKWHAIVKRFGLHVEICVGPITNEEACAWEIENIALMGTFSTSHAHDDLNDIGCNLTKGGEGATGYVHTERSLEKIQRKNVGNKNALGHKLPNDVRKKISSAVSAALMGHDVSEETRRKFATILKGNKRGIGNKANSGRTLSDEQRSKISQTMKKIRAIKRFRRTSWKRLAAS